MLLRPRHRRCLTQLVAGLLLGCPLAQAQVLEPAPSDPPHLLEGNTAPDDSAKPAWRLQSIAVPEKPSRILAAEPVVAPGSVRVETASGAWYAIGACEAVLCASLLDLPHGAERLPTGALPGSHMAAGRGRIARVWLADPAHRLDASAIGPLVAGALVVQDNTTKAFRLDLGLDQAFEDLRPRIASFDGQDTVFVVRSSVDQGAALIAVRLEGEGLLRIAGETAPVGRPGGWLNPIGFADFTGGGRLSIAVVNSPDQRGQLRILDFADGTFSTRFTVPGVSNHVPGGRVQDMAVIADFDGDKIDNIAVPDASRKIIRILSFAHGQVAEPADIALPSPVVTEIVGIRRAEGGRPMLLMGLEDGELVVLH